MKKVECRRCGSDRHYQSFCPLNRKYIKPGKHTIRDRQENKKFRDSQLNHEGYLICSCCGSWNGSDADHIESKGSHPESRYNPEKKQILCRDCHRAKTDHLPCKH